MFRVSFFSGDNLVACYLYDFRADAEDFIHSFVELTDPLFGRNHSNILALDHDFTVCLSQCENEVADGELLSRYVVYKG